MKTQNEFPPRTPSHRIHFLDLETTDLFADLGVILVACLQTNTGRMRVFRRDHYPGWTTGRTHDDALVRDLVRQFREGDVLVAYNGRRFDYPFLCGRALHCHIHVPTMQIVDPLQTVRRVVRISRRTLFNAARFLRLPEKFPLPIYEWRAAALNGSIDAMNALTRHCKQDVRVLMALTRKLLPYMPAREQRLLHEEVTR